MIKKSPMQCVEIVFGNLTNMELISGRNSATSTSNQFGIKDDDFCAMRMSQFEPLETA